MWEGGTGPHGRRSCREGVDLIPPGANGRWSACGQREGTGGKGTGKLDEALSGKIRDMWGASIRAEASGAALAFGVIRFGTT